MENEPGFEFASLTRDAHYQGADKELFDLLTNKTGYPKGKGVDFRITRCALCRQRCQTREVCATSVIDHASLTTCVLIQSLVLPLWAHSNERDNAFFSDDRGEGFKSSLVMTVKMGERVLLHSAHVYPRGFRLELSFIRISAG